ncbi:MAG: NAD(P)-binding domain-containing protein [archaeon]|nr:NAD(P)-binding domain-containing protein [archaeon]
MVEEKALKRIGVIGSGEVGKALAAGFKKHGYEVKIGSRNPEKLQEYSSETGIEADTDAQVAKYGQLIVLAVKGSEAENALDTLGIENIEGKTVIDTTNPIGDKAPENGVINFFTSLEESLHERLQKKAPKVNFVKAFNSIGSHLMVNPNFKEKPTMFYCGNNKKSRDEVKEILIKFGFEPQDMGEMQAARAIEPLCILWCIPGFRENQWRHAFKLLTR